MLRLYCLHSMLVETWCIYCTYELTSCSVWVEASVLCLCDSAQIAVRPLSCRELSGTWNQNIFTSNSVNQVNRIEKDKPRQWWWVLFCFISFMSCLFVSSEVLYNMLTRQLGLLSNEYNDGDRPSKQPPAETFLHLHFWYFWYFNKLLFSVYNVVT